MTATERELYVYGLAGTGLPRQLTILRNSLRTVSLDDAVDAVVGRARSRLDATTESLQRQHQIVAAIAARVSPFLPARFGSTIREDALRSMVSAHRGEVLAALDAVRDCDQMTIRVFGPPEPPPAGPPVSTGTAFLQRRRDHAHYLPREVAIIRGELAAWVKAERHVAGERGLRVTAFHLVSRGCLDQYRRRASLLQEKLVPWTVTVSGPWPAFAFAPQLF